MLWFAKMTLFNYFL